MNCRSKGQVPGCSIRPDVTLIRRRVACARVKSGIIDGFMRKILFLDFDGVLHADGASVRLSQFPLLESYLAKMPDVDIVISSTWREAYSLEKLRALFPASLRDKVIGVTPILEDSYDDGGRQREIEGFLRKASLNHKNAAWIALDDRADFFDRGCPFLLLVDPARAFSDDEGRKLLSWYHSVTTS